MLAVVLLALSARPIESVQELAYASMRWEQVRPLPSYAFCLHNFSTYNREAHEPARGKHDHSSPFVFVESLADARVELVVQLAISVFPEARTIPCPVFRHHVKTCDCRAWGSTTSIVFIMSSEHDLLSCLQVSFQDTCS